MKEDVIKVGVLDVTQLEKTAVESRKVNEREETYKEKVDVTRQVGQITINVPIQIINYFEIEVSTLFRVLPNFHGCFYHV